MEVQHVHQIECQGIVQKDARTPVNTSTNTNTALVLLTTVFPMPSLTKYTVHKVIKKTASDQHSDNVWMLNFSLYPPLCQLHSTFIAG